MTIIALPITKNIGISIPRYNLEDQGFIGLGDTIIPPKGPALEPKQGSPLHQKNVGGNGVET